MHLDLNYKGMSLSRVRADPMQKLSKTVFLLFTAGVISNATLAKEETVLELEDYIVGDKEQPAVSYFVPWKGTGSPDKLYWNLEDKNDKSLDMVDRDVMLRSIDIYDELQLEGPQ